MDNVRFHLILFIIHIFLLEIINGPDTYTRII